MEKGFNRQVSRRIISVACALVVCGLAILSRLYYLQVVDHQKLSNRAASQINEKVHFAPSRGDISDRQGRQLAADVEVESLCAYPGKIEDAAATARAIAGVTGSDRNTLRKKLEKDRSFVWIQRRVSPATASRIRELGLAGIGFEKEHRRFYPQRELAAQVIGLAGIDNQGLEGVELAYDSHLLNEGSFFVVEKDARGKEIFLAAHSENSLTDGREVRLTIDESIQFIAQEELARGVKEASARGGSIVVMDPRNGELLAMANWPYFNPNEFGRYGPSYFRNRTIADAAEPGSIMKPVLLAAALEEKAVTLRTLFFCENGSMRFMGRTLHDVHPHGYLDTAGVIVNSSNIGATKMAQQLGADSYYRYLRKFGFGEKSGIDLPGESRGLLRPVSEWSGLSISALAIGQEISTTPLQMAAAYSALVNGGVFFRPYAVKKIMGPGGEVVKSFGPTALRRVISEETSRKVKRVLVEVVENGTGIEAAVEGYTVGGKTGTAQKYDSKEKAYSREKYLASFTGAAPMKEPRLVVIVMIDEPEESIWGGSVAAPVFSRVVQRTLRYLNVPADDGARVLVVRS